MTMASSEEDDGTQVEYLQEIAYLDSTIDLDPETTCTICHAEFLDAEDLKMHMDHVHSTEKSAFEEDDTNSTECEEGSNKCEFCKASYSNLDGYAVHIASKHLRSLFCCKVCTKCYTEEYKVRRHEKKHKYNNAFACTQCSSVFFTEKEVAAHEIEFHINSDDGVFLPCLPNLSGFLKLNALKYLQSNERVLACHTCSLTKSNSTSEVKAYLKHLDDCDHPIYVCDVCSFIFKEKKTLIKHMNRKNKCQYPKDIISSLTTCIKCRKKVLCKDMRSHLDKCTIYNCYTCKQQFKTISELSAHQSTAHPVELDVIKCRFCSKEYVGQVALNKHIKRSHSHQFPLYKYACKTCDGIYKHPQELFAHYFTKHKDLQPYTCKICDKTFRVRKRFTIHIKLEHKGAGVVEFDENYLVFFASQRSENPFIPKCVIPEMLSMMSPDKDKNKKDINDMTTEAETEAEAKVEKAKPKPKRRVRKRMKEVEALSSSEEEEAENLLTLKKRAERKLFQRQYAKSSNIMTNNKRKQITCKVCNKYCYTVQNYQKHIKIHSKNKSFDCIKCSKTFKTKYELTNHMNKDHATSKLIETLKNVLKRKQSEINPGNESTVSDSNDNFENLTMSERFMRTVKKAKLEKQSVTVKIAPSTGTISVKNFIESFVPDPSEAQKDRKTVDEEPVVTIKEYNSPFYRKRSIYLTRFVPAPPPTEIKLRMPEKFKTNSYYDNQKVKLNVQIVNEPYKPSSLFFETTYQNDHNYETAEDIHDHDEYDDRNDAIPEVAHEIMLEGSDEPPKRNIIPDKPDLQAPQKIVIPKLPAGYNKIHIATLQPQAPFFKIITVKNEDNSNDAIVIDPQNVPEKKKHPEPPKLKKDVISLPDGTKFVSANPLEHLLGDKPVEELLQPMKNKYYSPKPKNIKGLLADALQNLENGNHRVRKRKAELVNEMQASKQQTSGPKKPKTAKVQVKAKESETEEIAYQKMVTQEKDTSEISASDSSQEKSVLDNSIFDRLIFEDGTEIAKEKEIHVEIETNEPGKSLPVL